MKKFFTHTIRRRLAAALLAAFAAVAVSTAVFDVIPEVYAETTGGTATTETTAGSTSASFSALNAGAGTSQKNIPGTVAETLQNFIVVLTIMLKVLYALLVPVAGMIGKFMSNDWVTGSVFRLDIVIETIWQFIRNLVNIIIIMYLLYVAARNIVPFGDNGQYDIKQVLPKVALALVVVNFSLFFCRTVLSFSNITTTMAFALPGQIGTSSMFEGFGAVPKFDANTGKPEAAAPPATTPTDKDGKALPGTGNAWNYKHRWIIAGTGTKDKGSGKEVEGVPFNPFVWAEPLGQSDRQGLSASCPSGYSPSYRPVVQANGSTVNQSVCLNPNNSADFTIPAPIEGSGSIYAMECLHKNYAFNAADSLFSQSGPTLIANPGYNSATHSYVMQPAHFKRILIDKEAKMINQLSTDVWNLVYANKQAEVLSQAEQAKKGITPTFPYYSDCIGSLDELAFSSRNAMYIYAFNLLRIPSYEKSFVDITSYSDVTLRVMMSFFFLFMFFGVTIAMLVAMVARTFYIWFMMILSPVWVLTDIIKIWKGDQVDKEGVIGGFGKFISLAFLPTILGLILSIGFMMFHFLMYMASLGGESAGRFSAGSISLWFNPGEAVGGLGDIFASMFGLFAIAALWVAVFAAFSMGFKNMQFVSGLLTKINSTSKAAASFAATAPLEIPFLPVGKGGARVSASTLMGLPRAMMNKISNDRTQRRSAEFEAMGWSGNDLSPAMVEEIKNTLKQQSTPQQVASVMKRSVDTFEGKQMNDGIYKLLFDSSGNVKSQAELLKGGNVQVGDQTVKVHGQNLVSMASKMTPEQRSTYGKQFVSGSVQSAVSSNRFNDPSWQAMNNERQKFLDSITPNSVLNFDQTNFDAMYVDGNVAGTTKNMIEVKAFLMRPTTTQATPIPQNAQQQIENVVNMAALSKVSGADVKSALNTFGKRNNAGIDLLNMPLASGGKLSDRLKQIYDAKKLPW